MRSRQGAADDEAEVAWPGTGNQTGVGAGHQRINDRCRVLAALRHRPAEHLTHTGRVDPGVDRALMEGVQEHPVRAARPASRPEVRSGMGTTLGPAD